MKEKPFIEQINIGSLLSPIRQPPYYDTINLLWDYRKQLPEISISIYICKHEQTRSGWNKNISQ
jgi:hypothetical protein